MWKQVIEAPFIAGDANILVFEPLDRLEREEGGGWRVRKRDV